MSSRLLILGAGGHGRVVADAALDCGYGEVAFLDDARTPQEAGEDFAVLGPIDALAAMRGGWPRAFVGIGDNHRRLALLDRLIGEGFEVPSIVHPTARISRAARVGTGVYVGPMAVVNTGAVLGDGVIVNTGACIDHDCRIGAGTHVAPGAALSGRVVTGRGVWLGTGCAIRQDVVIGDGAVVGVGAAVVCNLAGGATYVGVPARSVATKESC